jgi:GTP-binding protein
MALEISSAQFFKSIFSLAELPKDNFPQVAFAGKSNVGKSSLINVLCNQKKLAQISKTPGKTKALNFFTINNNLYFVDLPGYGYAKVSKQFRQIWSELIEGYMKNCKQIRGIVFILDLRHPPSEDDLQMKVFLDHYQLDYLTVLTKADKLSSTEKSQNLNIFQEVLKSDDFVVFSAQTKEGKNKILGWIKSLL